MRGTSESRRSTAKARVRRTAGGLVGCRCAVTGWWHVVLTALLLSAVPRAGGAQGLPVGAVDIAVWLDRGSAVDLVPGDEVRVYYRTSRDAYVALFHLASDGTVRLVFPHHPGVQPLVRGGRTYRLLPGREATWRVGDVPGEGGFFAVAGDRPPDLSTLRYQPDAGWRLLPVRPFGDLPEAIAAYEPEILSGAVRVWATAGTAYRVVARPDDPRFFRYLRPLDPRQRSRPVLRRRPRTGQRPPHPWVAPPPVRIRVAPRGGRTSSCGATTAGRCSPDARIDEALPSLRDPGGPG